MNRAELQGALDELGQGFLAPLRDGHGLAYWRTELQPESLRIVARRARRTADELERVAESQERTNSSIGGAAE